MKLYEFEGKSLPQLLVESLLSELKSVENARASILI